MMAGERPVFWRLIFNPLSGAAVAEEVKGDGAMLGCHQLQHGIQPRPHHRLRWAWSPPLCFSHTSRLLHFLHSTLMVSAGPAGLVCAETLRQEGFTDRIVMCTMDRHPPYDRPKLSKVCTQRPKASKFSGFVLWCTNSVTSVFREHSRAAATALRGLPAGPWHRTDDGERGEPLFSCSNLENDARLSLHYYASFTSPPCKVSPCSLCNQSRNWKG